VTDAKQTTVEVRALVSSTDLGKAFDLRCELRERLIAKHASYARFSVWLESTLKRCGAGSRRALPDMRMSGSEQKKHLRRNADARDVFAVGWLLQNAKF